MNSYSLSAIIGFKKMYLNKNDNLDILDVGSYDVNGTSKDIFDYSNWKYTGMDIKEGPNVDVIYDNNGVFPFDDNIFDVVVSSNTFEHDPKFWITFSEMVRVAKNNAFIFIDTPSAGPVHRYPVDCWRFYPDAYKALSEWKQEAKLLGQDINEMSCNNCHDEPNFYKPNIGVFRVDKSKNG